MTRPYLPVILIIFALATLTASQDIDNGIMGMPEIQCNADTIEMKFRTKKKFAGKIYVQGHYNDASCRVDYAHPDKEGHPIGGIRLSHGACDMDRQRMIKPEGMQFSTVIVISFHPLFVTKVDRAFHINCMYRETVQTVNQQLEVSSIPTEEVQNDMPIPMCTYTIRKDEIDGPILKYARVGDQVVHRWECDTDMYGLLVHSCFVEDGQGEKQLIIDERGCHRDRLVLGDPTYTEALNMAYRESYVFKFADRVGVRFQCEIRLCVKESGGCNGVTPPDCSGPAIGGWNNKSAILRKVAKRDANPNVIKGDLISQYVYVIDNDGETDPNSAEASQLASITPLSDTYGKVCFSSPLLMAIVGFAVVAFIIAVAVVIISARKDDSSKSIKSPDSIPRIRPSSIVLH
uniref:ZP domain-containing protein n=1 Tax=Panagrellus redivivus TaxID=6233 RepID=A0A7E4W2H8_PANRE